MKRCDPFTEKWDPFKKKWDPFKKKWDPFKKKKWDPFKKKWDPFNAFSVQKRSLNVPNVNELNAVNPERREP